MNRRSFFSVLAAIAAVLLGAGVAGAVWLGTQSPLTLLAGRPVADPAAAVLISKRAPIALSLLVNPDRLEVLRQVLAAPSRRRQTHQEWQETRDRWLAKTGINYDRDVRPWLGDEVTWAVTNLDLDRDPSNGAQPGYLLATTTRDAVLSRDFLQLFWQQQALAGVNLHFEQYQGARLVYGENMDLLPTLGGSRRGTAPARPMTVATALVGDRFVLFANDPKVLREAINSAQAVNLSLASQPDYQRAIAQLRGERIGAGFVNVGALGAWLDWSDAEPLPDLAVQQVALALDLAPDGLQIDWTAVAGDRFAPSNPTLTEPVVALNYLPPNTMGAIGGRNLASLQTTLAQQVADTDLDRQLRPLLAQFADYLGLDWGRDLAPWLTGDYALGLVPVAGNPLPETRSLGEFPGDLVFVGRREPGSAEAIAALDQVARAKGLSVGSLALGDREAVVWTQLLAPPQSGLFGWRDEIQVTAQVQGARAIAGDYVFFSTSVPALAAALGTIPAPSNDPSSKNAPSNAPPSNHKELPRPPALTTSDRFTQTLAALATPNDGYVYLDWFRSRPAIATVIPVVRVLDWVAAPLSDRLDTAALSSYGGASGLRTGSVVIRFRAT
jgi:hypothetical protein